VVETKVRKFVRVGTAPATIFCVESTPRDVEAQTILVVDDDADTRDAMCELLSLYGYRVACADNGLAALDQIQTWQAPPALILLDLCMPVMDGQTFLLRARQDRRVKNMPIIVITGDLLTDLGGVDAVLTKPLRPERLLPTVSRFVKPTEVSSCATR
jgi:two-component system, OmpR family, response regulator CpxR